MESINDVQVGSVVQISPDTKNGMFSGCMMTVTKIEKWGCKGYVQALGEKGKPGGQAYYRASWDEMEFVGDARWVIERGDKQ